MESFYEIIRQNEQWIWIITIIISIIWYIFHYRRAKRLRRESQQQQKEYYDCFDDEGNYIEGKMEEYMKKQKERYSKYYKESQNFNNYIDDRPEKPDIGDLF